MLARPGAEEYAPHFAGYIDLADDDVLAALARQGDATRALVATLSEEDGTFRYASGKWSVKEILGHIADTERVMALRLLWAARGDRAPLPGFDQNPWTAAARYDDASMEALRAQLSAVRQATVSLAALLPAEAWTNRAVVGGSEMSARALVYVIAGHELHHQAVLRERYLPALSQG